MPDPAKLQAIVNHSIVALVGMLGGLIVGYLLGCDARPVRRETLSRDHSSSPSVIGGGR